MSFEWSASMPEQGRVFSKESDTAWKLGVVHVVDTGMSCQRTLNITLFFDGTNNNDDKDNPFRDSLKHAHTNVARLYNAALDDKDHGIFPHYIAGVGTPLKDVGELVYTSMGKAMAKGFSARCVLGYIHVLNSVHACITKNGDRLLIEQSETQKLCEQGANGNMQGFAQYVNALGVVHKDAHDDHAWPRTIKKVWINLIGFSRGAACARAFAHKLINQWAPGGNLGNLAGKHTIAYEINFMGLFDTVASVGLPYSTRAMLDISLFAGHEAFASGGAMEIPQQVRFCRHAISMHEQRMSFPFDSIRKGDVYPDGIRKEVAYPGVHSDVGGGYRPSEQGKACGKSKFDDSYKLSQIPLHDMYVAALRYGVPLMKAADIQKDSKVASDFALAPETITAFNAWLATVDRSIHRVEDATKFGMAQLLSWRTLRAQYKTRHYITEQPFFRNAHEDPMTPRKAELAWESALKTDPQLQELNAQIHQAEQDRAQATSDHLRYPSNMPLISACFDRIKAAQEAIARRQEALCGEVAHRAEPGRPGEDAYSITTNDKTDLLQGAEEMRLLLGHLYPDQADSKWYVQRTTSAVPPSNRTYPPGLPPPPPPPQLAVKHASPMKDPDSPLRDLPVDVPQMRLVDGGIIGHALVTAIGHDYRPDDDVIAVPHENVKSFLLEHTSPAAIAQLPAAAIALFDNYVHDSRCWFRVPFFHEYAPGGYGWPRVIFIGGDKTSPWFGFDPLPVRLGASGANQAGAARGTTTTPS